MEPITQLESMIDALKSARTRVARELLGEFLRDPFWEARYGEKGRKYILSDSGYHLDYLATALEAGDPQLYAGYWAWLRPLLVMRGMSTRHLELTLAVLERRLGFALGDEYRHVGAYLVAARGALAYRRPAAAALAAVTEPVVGRVHAQVEAPGGDKAGVEEKLRSDLAYLADTLEIERPDLFAGYFAWMENYLGEAGWQPAFTQRLLRLTMEAVNAHLGADLGAAFVPAVGLVLETRA